MISRIRQVPDPKRFVPKIWVDRDGDLWVQVDPKTLPKSLMGEDRYVLVGRSVFRWNGGPHPVAAEHMFGYKPLVRAPVSRFPVMEPRER